MLKENFNGKSKNNGKDEMRGSFATLRMTTLGQTTATATTRLQQQRRRLQRQPHGNDYNYNCNSNGSRNCKLQRRGLA
jgi:hypothetical protein